MSADTGLMMRDPDLEQRLDLGVLERSCFGGFCGRGVGFIYRHREDRLWLAAISIDHR